jgi:hypothetical protein
VIHLAPLEYSLRCENVGNPQPYGWRLDAAANGMKSDASRHA